VMQDIVDGVDMSHVNKKKGQWVIPRHGQGLKFHEIKYSDIELNRSRQMEVAAVKDTKSSHKLIIEKMKLPKKEVDEEE
jgi:hypothetical protein